MSCENNQKMLWSLISANSTEVSKLNNYINNASTANEIRSTNYTPELSRIQTSNDNQNCMPTSQIKQIPIDRSDVKFFEDFMCKKSRLTNSLSVQNLFDCGCNRINLTHSKTIMNRITEQTNHYDDYSQSLKSKLKFQKYLLENNKPEKLYNPPIFMSNSLHDVEENKEFPTICDKSLRIISVPIRRLKGVCLFMQRNTDIPTLFEVFGRCTVNFGHFRNVPGLSFNLEECKKNQVTQILTCALYDFDEINPDIKTGNLYRCVGRYHTKKNIFQCYNIEEGDENTLKVMETLQYHSDLELARLTRVHQYSRKLTVSKVPWKTKVTNNFSKAKNIRPIPK